MGVAEKGKKKKGNPRDSPLAQTELRHELRRQRQNTFSPKHPLSRSNPVYHRQYLLLPSPFNHSLEYLTMSDLRSIVPELRNALDRNQLDAANNLLSRAKRSLLLENALIPTPSTSPQLISLAREVLEFGAIASIRQTDADTFTRYYQQLQPFYDLERHASTPGASAGNVDFGTSQRSKITGLYLLLLLSSGNSTNFHTVLEGLVEEASLNGKSVEDDPYIKYPVELERNLMEGSYDKVWRETKSERVPSEDFGLFSNVCLHDGLLYFL